MDRPVTALFTRLCSWIDADGLQVGDRRACAILHQQFEAKLAALDAVAPQSVIFLAERDPIAFLAGFLAAIARNCPVFLCNPHWQPPEWQQLFNAIRPDLIWGDIPAIPPHSPSPLPKFTPPRTETPCILIPTGGSSGKIRFAIHTVRTLTASVRGFCEYFDRDRVNSFCVLPLYHVSGLMQFWRSLLTGGNLAIFPSYKAIPQQIPPNFNPSNSFISLVPTQLQRLLTLPQAAAYLARFEAVLLGGAPAWSDLFATARTLNIPLAPTYGMTETASGVVTLKPEDFLAGNNSSGRVLPHARLKICTPTGETLKPGEIGMVAIAAKSLALGYFPQNEGNASNPFDFNFFNSDDLGYIDDRGYLQIVGRNSDKIITGGENVFPAEVEAAIRATGLVKDVCAIAVSDPDWGEAIAAVYVPRSPDLSPEHLSRALEGNLAHFKRPKHWWAIEQLPRNDRGKLNREQLQKQFLEKMQNLTATATIFRVPHGETPGGTLAPKDS
ncbi:2-succinylbenzoate--CoA ligase [Oxynema aestuarii]|uniref:2-succinylbenzoate--CoA ligase n=1 Tax=Oxynema aestuarii AP17 TaxID=2064643 RepID=A0A6H1U0Q6_9CYAN|nr:2-succinylbenzoate--CoA ligase [Oxynema aestuarii]QIZ72026.1 2-succinylbenzoate--CoA ligase [Oxynema aestuarii AP17]